MELKEKIEKTALGLLNQNGYKKVDKPITGYAMIPEQMLEDNTIGRSELRVYSEIIRRSSSKGYTWITSRTIADKLNITKKTVDRALAKLRSKKYIVSKTVKKINNMEVRIIMPLFGINFITNHTNNFLSGKKIDTSLDKMVSLSTAKMEPTSPPKVHQDKYNLLIKDSSIAPTTTCSSRSRTPGKHTIQVLEEYRKLVDSKYILQPKDIDSLNEFEFVQELVKYMPYWNNYINPRLTSYYDHSSEPLDDFDANHTAKLHIMVKRWNSFKEYAENKIQAEESKKYYQERREWEEKVNNLFFEALPKLGLTYQEFVEKLNKIDRTIYSDTREYIYQYAICDRLGVEGLPDYYYRELPNVEIFQKKDEQISEIEQDTIVGDIEEFKRKLLEDIREND